MKGWLAGIVIAIGTLAWGHVPAPEEVVASISAPPARASMGVERAERDGRNPRLLLIRVGAGWFARSRAARAETAAEWRASWRHAVPQGVVAVLDASTDRVVVRYGPGGDVTDVRDRG